MLLLKVMIGEFTHGCIIGWGYNTEGWNLLLNSLNVVRRH